MKLIKIILTKNKNLKKKIDKIIKLKEIKSNKDYIIYKGERTLFKKDEIIIFAQFINFDKTIKYIKENYDIFKIIIAGTANNLGNIDLKNGDIIIPNTFIQKDKEAIFIDYAIGENYNLHKFGLMLSGICISGENHKSTNFIADINDNNSYNLLEIIKNEDLLGKTVIIKEITDKTETDKLNNIINVIDLVL